MKTNNQFKNIHKRLRNNGNASLLPLSKNRENKMKPTNCYDCLNIISCEVNEVTKLTKVNVSTQNNCIFSCLPEDTINIILQYLPIATRLKMFKSKYNRKIIHLKLQNMHNKKDIKKMFDCARTAQKVLKIVLKPEIFSQHKYLSLYKIPLIELILTAIKHYIHIYKKQDKFTKIIEKMMFTLYLQLILL